VDELASNLEEVKRKNDEHLKKFDENNEK